MNSRDGVITLQFVVIAFKSGYVRMGRVLASSVPGELLEQEYAVDKKKAFVVDQANRDLDKKVWKVLPDNEKPSWAFLAPP